LTAPIIEGRKFFSAIRLPSRSRSMVEKSSPSLKIVE
jgi:hypothetical protein